MDATAQANALLAEVEPLAACDRERRLVEVALSAPADLGGMIDWLTAISRGRDSSFFAGRAGLLLAAVSRDTDRLAQFLVSPYPRLSGQAVHILARLQPRLLASRVAGLAPGVQDRVIAELTGTGARAEADRLMRALLRNGQVEAAGRLLPGCSADVACELLPRLSPGVHRVALARRHPDLAWQRLQAELCLGPLEDAWAGARATQVLLALRTSGHKDLRQRVTEFAMEPEHLPLISEALALRLVRDDPRRVFAMWEAGWDPWVVPGRLSHRAWGRFLSDPRWRDAGAGADLRAAVGNTPDYQLLSAFAAVPPRVRARPEMVDLIVDCLGEEAALPLLPRGEARARAYAMVQAARQAGELSSPAVVRYLDAPDAGASFSAFLLLPGPMDRAAGLAGLIASAAADADRTRLLAALSHTGLTSEREPVRAAALAAIAHIPPALVDEEVATRLLEVTRAVAQAPDHSETEGRLIADLRDSLLRSGLVTRLDTPLGQLATPPLTGHDFMLPVLDGPLAPATMEALIPVLLPAAQQCLAQDDDPSCMVQLLAGIGPRFADSAQWRECFLAALDPTLQEYWAPQERVIRRLERWWIADPATRRERIRQLVEAWPGRATDPPLWRVVSRRFTDLIGPEVVANAPQQRWVSNPLTRWVPRDLRGAPRWTPRQWSLLARYLAATLDAEEEQLRESPPMFTRREGTHRAYLRPCVALGLVPDAGRPVLLQYLGSAQWRVRGWAARGLREADHPDEVVAVLGAQPTMPAGWAGAITAAARFLPADPVLVGPVLAGPARANTVLDRALPGADGRGTSPQVARSVMDVRVRLGRPLDDVLAVARTAPPESVTGAVLAAAWKRRWEPGAWEVVEAWAPRTARASRLLDRVRPCDLAEEDRPRFAALVCRILAAQPADMVVDARVRARSRVRLDSDTELPVDVLAAARVREAALEAAGRWAEWEPGLIDAVFQAAASETFRPAWYSAAATAVTLLTCGWNTRRQDGAADDAVEKPAGQPPSVPRTPAQPRPAVSRAAAAWLVAVRRVLGTLPEEGHPPGVILGGERLRALLNFKDRLVHPEVVPVAMQAVGLLVSATIAGTLPDYSAAAALRLDIAAAAPLPGGKERYRLALSDIASWADGEPYTAVRLGSYLASWIDDRRGADGGDLARGARLALDARPDVATAVLALAATRALVRAGWQGGEVRELAEYLASSQPHLDIAVAAENLLATRTP